MCVATTVLHSYSMKRRDFPAFVALALFFSSPLAMAAEESNLNVQGVGIGGSLADAEAAIKNLYPEFKKKQIRNHLNKPYGFSFVKDLERRGNSQMVIGVDSQSRVLFVGQARNFSDGERPDYETLRESLVDKYGEPTLPAPLKVPVNTGKYSVPEYFMAWSYTDGKTKPFQVPGHYDMDKNPCDAETMGDDHSQTNGANIFIPRTTKATCKVQVQAKIRFDYYTKRVVALSVTVSDAAALYADPVLGQASREAEAKRGKLLNEGKSKAKVDL